LKQASEISPEDNIVKTNLAFAYYLNSDYSKAKNIVSELDPSYKSNFLTEIKQLLKK